MKLKLKVIIGSTRPGRVGPTIADWVAGAAQTHGEFDVETVDLADMNLQFLDEEMHPAMGQYQHEHTKKWSAVVADADAFIFVTPEYDFFAPATLVNAVQVLLNEWRYKAAAVVSYGYVSGGLRAAQTMRHLLSNVGVMPISQVVPVPFFPQFIGDEGGLEPNEQMTSGVNEMLDELCKWSGALKTIREK